MKKKVLLLSLIFLFLLLDYGCGKTRNFNKEDTENSQSIEEVQSVDDSIEGATIAFKSETVEGSIKDSESVEKEGEDIKEGEQPELTNSEQQELEYIIARLNYVFSEESTATKSYAMKDMTEHQKIYLVTLFYNDGTILFDTSKVEDTASFQEKKSVLSEYLKKAIGVGLEDSSSDLVTIQLGDYGDGLPYATVDGIIAISDNQVKIEGDAGIESGDGIIAYPFEAIATKSSHAMFGGYIINEISIKIVK